MFTTDYTFKFLLDFQLQNKPLATIGNAWYIGLSSTLINSDGTNITELSEHGYSRRSYPRGADYWSIPENGETHNIQEIYFTLTKIENTFVKSIFISNNISSIANTSIFYVCNINPYIDLGKHASYRLALLPGSIKIQRFGKTGEYYAGN